MSYRYTLIVTVTLHLLSWSNALTFTSVTSKYACSSSTGSSFLSKDAITIYPEIGSDRNPTNFLEMKVSRGKSKQARSKGSQIALSNEARMKSAGRKGTKNFVDPNKLFVGNLSYNATESHLKNFLLERGIQEINIEAVKIIRDWKTGKSKGYGFIQFVGPIYATSALELIKGKRLLGRIVRLDQGKKKSQDPMVVVKNEKVAPKSTEEEVILNALNEAEDNTEEEEGYDELDTEAQQDVLEEGSFLDEYDDALLFDDDDDDDDDDFEYDGVYVEEFLPNENEEDEGPMNREQRREAAKKNKKRRKPGRGFGNLIPTTK